MLSSNKNIGSILSLTIVHLCGVLAMQVVPTENEFKLAVLGSDKCLTFPGGVGRSVYLSDCADKNTRSNQEWVVNRETLTLRAYGTLLCLESFNNGGDAYLAECHPTEQKQKWRYACSGNNGEVCHVVNTATNLCLVQTRYENSKAVIVSDCDANDVWSVKKFIPMY
ncbi:Adseverin [Folsomia candida]|uniref:Adseverin n=2 Tax=Folsomia candida TaxID=158441 RepID=A0A226D2P1_FOLCA|nr:Adseverin [Folsomia candida]